MVLRGARCADIGVIIRPTRRVSQHTTRAKLVDRYQKCYNSNEIIPHFHY
jgi:hypothetical protein